jgi:hypothetical protein
MAFIINMRHRNTVGLHKKTILLKAALPEKKTIWPACFI